MLQGLQREVEAANKCLITRGDKKKREERDK